MQALIWADLSACVATRWAPRIGDPNLAGWLTVAAYVLCAVLEVTVWSRAAERGRERLFWAMVAVIMALLAVNKQLDLQSALTALGRCIAQMQGWYDQRRGVQIMFIQGLLGATAIALILGLILMRHHLRRDGVAILGLIAVAGFVAVRAVGFHHVDTLLKATYLDLRFNVLFEMSGLILIAGNALALLARRPSDRRAAEVR